MIILRCTKVAIQLLMKPKTVYSLPIITIFSFDSHCKPSTAILHLTLEILHGRVLGEFVYAHTFVSHMTSIRMFVDVIHANLSLLVMLPCVFNRCIFSQNPLSRMLRQNETFRANFPSVSFQVICYAHAPCTYPT